MNPSISKLRKDHKVAFARIMSDLIKADRIIDSEEIQNFHDMFGGSSWDLFVEAQQMTFAKAIRTLSNTSNAVERNLIKKALHDVANCDGICDPSEALLMMAIESSIEQSRLMPCEVMSAKMTDHFFGSRFAIFVENGYDWAINQNILDNYSVISHLLTTIGFQFLYVPEYCKLYAKLSHSQFISIAKYFLPTIETLGNPSTVDDVLQKRHNEISNAHTSEFVKQHLIPDLGLKLSGAGPSFLFMVGTSEVMVNVGNKMHVRKYADFMRIGIPNNDARGVIDRFVADFNKKVSYNSFSTFNPTNQRLAYQGVYKLFFNLMVRPNEAIAPWRVNIDTNEGSVYVNDTSTGLGQIPASVFTLILYATLEGDKAGLPIQPNEEEEVHYNELFHRICTKLKVQRKWVAPLYNRLQQHVNEINKQIQAAAPAIAGFIKIGRNNGYYQLMTVTDSFTIDENRLADTDFFDGIEPQ